MKSCEDYQSRISGWLDGELADAGRLELLDHFARCAACRRFYLEARALDGLVAGIAEAPGEPLPREMWERIAARAGGSVVGRIRTSRRSTWMLRVAALLALALGVGYWQLRESARPASPQPASQIEVLLEQDQGEMSETRFVELTTEVLRADRRFHRAMLEVMEQVVADTSDERSPEASEGRGDERIEEGGEGKTRNRDLA